MRVQHYQKKTLGNTNNIYTIKVYFSLTSKLFINKLCPPVSYVMVFVQTSKDARFKIKIWKTYHSHRNSLYRQSITITLEAFKNENYETVWCRGVVVALQIAVSTIWD